MSAKKIAMKKQAESIIKHLEKRDMKGYYCEDGSTAVTLALELMEKGSVVSWGGSETLKEIGLLDTVCRSNYKALDRKLAITKEEKQEYKKQTVCSDYYLLSTNAITLDGQLINIDGNGNRVANLIYGPEHVLVLCGMNKVVTDVASGVERIRNMAAPANGTRLETKTPCAAVGCCHDCLVPDCMCCEIVITRKTRTPGRITVILIGEELGY